MIQASGRLNLIQVDSSLVLTNHVYPPTLKREPPPPAYGDHSISSLAIPFSRLSDSSRSEEGSGDRAFYAQTTTTHTISTTTTTFFRLPRRKKDKGHLFPLPDKGPGFDSGRSSTTGTPQDPASGRTSISPVRQPLLTGLSHSDGLVEEPVSFPSPTHSTLALTNAPLGAPGPAIFRKGSTNSFPSGASTPSLQIPAQLSRRGRSSTVGSFGLSAKNEFRDSPPPLTASGRDSTSTGGRKSFGDIFSLTHRLRQNSEPPLRNGAGVPGTPASTGSKPGSFQIPRDIAYPERAEEDTPATYLVKLEEVVPRGLMASILCKDSDDFSKTCLRKYMRGFSYFVDSIDMAVRKMLMEVELPKETQQIDRLLQGFADRYCECNPGIFISVDEAYFLTFSILLLHSDTHNKNNKKKMQKQDYVKNTQDQVEVSQDILECFYENVSYTPFIHFEDEVAINSHRLAAPKARKSVFRTPSTDNLRGPIDPYTLILDNRLDALRPPLKDVMDTEDTHNFMGTATTLDAESLHHAFFKFGVLQIVSARSRPDAFLTQATISNPAEAQAGLVDIKAAKVGLLWRKDTKKKKTKSPWQEWGAILTSSKLYFFRDVGWIRKLMSQQDLHQKQNPESGPVLFKPPLTTFEPDALMPMDDAVALLDSSYKKHKHAFLFIKHGGFEEVFLANDEADMNDWMAKLNYAATFRTAGIRMRGHMGPTYDGLRQNVITESPISLDEDQNKSEIRNGATDYRNEPSVMAQNMAYRFQIMKEKVVEAEEKLSNAQRELDSLLRNARHLQILTPIQARTREALVLAAGRMSAKLKWTRVEMWKTRCYRDILNLDINQGLNFAKEVTPSETSSSISVPQKSTPLKLKHQSLTKPDSRPSDTPPSAQTSRSGSHTRIDRVRSIETPSRALSNISTRTSLHKSIGSLELASTTDDVSASPNGKAPYTPNGATGSHSLDHQISVLSSHRQSSNSENRLSTPTNDFDDGEEQLLRDAGILVLDPASPTTRRPRTSGSERDRVRAISPTEITPKDRGGVRRSLQRTLRDSHHGPHLPHHHRGKKVRDSGSSFIVADDGVRSVGGGNDGLTRGTGSFIVHGKKASVITFGSEWQSMSPEERMKLRKSGLTNDAKEENAVEDSNASMVSDRSGDEGERSRSNSTVTALSRQEDENESTDDMDHENETDMDSRQALNSSPVFSTPPSGLNHSPRMSHTPQMPALQA